MKYVVRFILFAMLEVSAKSQETIENDEIQEQSWNWHVQNTDIVPYHPGFRAAYSGLNSLNSASEISEVGN